MAMFNSYVRLPEGNGQELGVDLGWPLSLNWVSNCALWGMLGDFPPNFRTSWWRAKTSLKIFFCLEGWWKSVDVVVFTMVNPMIPSSYSTATLHGPTAWRHVFLGLIGEWDWEIPPWRIWSLLGKPPTRKHPKGELQVARQTCPSKKGAKLVYNSNNSNNSKNSNNSNNYSIVVDIFLSMDSTNNDIELGLLPAPSQHTALLLGMSQLYCF